MKFLLARLYGPLAAWGEGAGDEVRPTTLVPTRSALLGLFAAALGIRRDDADGHRRMAASLLLAVRVDAVGSSVVDFHTVQEPKLGRRDPPPSSRRQALDHPKIDTHVSRRHYRCDAAYQIAAWTVADAAWEHSLEELREALLRPRFVPFLGRKSCPLALPMSPALVEAESLAEALRTAEAPGGLRAIVDGERLLAWEGPRALAGLEEGVVVERVRRHDEPRRREGERTWAARQEWRARWPDPPEEAPRVPQ